MNMRPKMTSVLALVFAGVGMAAEPAPAVSPFVIKSWGTLDGLPQNTVTAIAQTPDGYLWLGTRGGLARFDGVRFRNFGLADGLQSLTIWRLAEDGQGGLWIGTVGGGLSHWRDGAISTLTHADGLAHDEVLALAPAEPGAVWVGTKAGLQHCGPNGLTPVIAGVPGRVVALAADPAGGVWLTAAAGGLFHSTGTHCEPVSLPAEERLAYGHCLLVDHQGDLWMSIGNGKVLRRHAGAWTQYGQAHGVPFEYLGCLAQCPTGEIWAGSPEAGLFVFREGRFHAMPGFSDGIRSIRQDPDGVLWLGTLRRGLIRVLPRRVTEYAVGQDHRFQQVGGLVEDPPGRFWVSTYGGGLYNGTLDRLAPVADAAVASRGRLTTGLKTSDGATWFGGNNVLLRRDSGTEKFRALSFAGSVMALCEAGDGSLWLATREGELRQLVNGVPQPVPNGAFPVAINGLARDTGAAFWVATQGAGLFRWEAGQVRHWGPAEGLPTGVLRALHQDRYGTLWIGTVGGGLAWLEQGRIHTVDTRQGLGDDIISQILEDELENLWLGCNRGIFRLSKRELREVAAGRSPEVHPLVLDETDGMSVAECTGTISPAGLKTQAGTLCFSTLAGVVEIDPAQFGPAPAPPSVLIEEILLDGKPAVFRNGTLTLPAGSRELEIRFTAFNYARPEHLRFRHRLAGGNAAWVDSGGTRTVRYSQLPPGAYGFEVTAANPDLRWQENAAGLAFTVLPFWWQTPWFRVVAGLALAAAGGGVVIWRNRAKRRAELAEMEHVRRLSAERARADESRLELAHLSRVSILGELAGTLAHELNQPLAAMLSNAQVGGRMLAAGQFDPIEIPAIFADIADDAKRAGGIIHGMRAMLKKDAPAEKQVLDLNDAVTQVLGLLHSEIIGRKVEAALQLDPSLPTALANHVEFQQVLINLILNGLDAMAAAPQRGPLRISTARQETSVSVAVHDSGPGLPPEILDRLFAPFVTTKPGGLGLGLSISRSIMQRCGGELQAENHPTGGALFRIVLPVG
jgi:signal transduction histidine kinase/ligand-binding sensor domain-containing protein